MPGSSRLMSSITCSVEALPVLSTDMSTAWWPATRTRLVCGLDPSCTLATSRMNTTVPLTVRIGASLSSSGRSGLELSLMLYSMSSIFSVPAGMIRFCSPIALLTSTADRPLERSASGSMSTCTSRCLPP
jgi:hypothetical protein